MAYPRSSSNDWRPPPPHRASNRSQITFNAPPFDSRPVLFCCPVAESNPAHLTRSFVNPGRHLMNTQLKGFLECADDPRYDLAKCDVSHMVEVTTRLIHHRDSVPYRERPFQSQWNLPSSTMANTFSNITPPIDSSDDTKSSEEYTNVTADMPYSTYQSMSTRYFSMQNSNDAWQVPPHSRSFREAHGESKRVKIERERYMEIPPFKTMPHTSENVPGGNAGSSGARPWIPSCSIILWCNKHSNFYEVHILS